jgi:hypothetical protein
VIVNCPACRHAFRKLPRLRKTAFTGTNPAFFPGFKWKIMNPPYQRHTGKNL